MRRRVVVAFALVASVLAVTAMPVAASHGPVVVSQHTTDTDFADATLTNMSVNGSGQSATVEFVQPNVTVDGYEDGDVAEYEGDVGGLSAQSTTVRSGNFAAQYSGNGSFNTFFADASTGLPRNISQGDSFSFAMRYDGDDEQVVGLFATHGERQEHYRIQADDGTNSFNLQLDNRGDGGSLTTLDSLAAEINPNEWYEFDVDWGTDGSITVTIKNDSVGTVGTLNATDNTYTSGGIGGVTGSTSNNFFWDAWRIVNPPAPAEYVGSNHTVEQSEKAWFNITENTNATVTITTEAWDGSSWVQLAQTAGITTTGNKTLTWSPSAHDTVRNRVLVENDTTNGEPAFTLADESVGFTGSAPVVNNSSASPTGTLDTAKPTIEIDVNDSDFPLDQGDSVTAELFVDGTSEGTDTLTANGTASVTVSEPLTGGDHTYHWVASDSYGHSTTSDTFSITVPSQLTIRNETSPYGVVQGCNAVVRFFEDADTDPVIVERTDDDGDGNVSLAGLPTGTQFTATVKCDGYHNRTALIDSLFEQQSVFLLSKDRPAVENRFTVEDNTGEFPPESTEIIVQKAINRSKYDSSADGFSWTTVAGDDLGADRAFVVDLEDEDRYRLVVRNDVGETRVLGAYVAETTGTIALTIGQVSISGDTQAGTAFGATLRDLENGRDVQLFYYDTQDATTGLDILIYNKSNASDELLNTTITDPSQRHVETQPIPSSAPDDVTYVVQVNATRSGHPDVSFEAEVGAIGKLFADLPMDQQVLSLIGWTIWFAATAWFALRSPRWAPAGSTLLAAFGSIALGVFHVPPEILGMMGAISVLFLVAGDNP